LLHPGYSLGEIRAGVNLGHPDHGGLLARIRLTALANLESGKTVIFQLNNAYMLDHTVMEFIHDFQHNYEGQGGKCMFLGLEYHDTYSRHPLAVRRMKRDNMSRRKSDHYGV
jgi:MFS superfamily sulfate permease-like transporter